MLTPYRSSAIVLPKQHVSCTDDSPCRCHLARPKSRWSALDSTWRRIVVPGTALFGVFGVTLIAAASAIPKVGVAPVVHASSRAPVRARACTTGSLLLGAVHDPEALYSYAQAAKREGLDVTLVDAWITTPTSTSFDEALGLSSRDVVLSVDGRAYSSSWLADVGYKRHVVELRRDGRLVVVSVRRGG